MHPTTTSTFDRTARLCGHLRLAGGFALLLVACGGGGSSGGGVAATPAESFAREQIDQTSETSEPVEINGTSFSFSEDPAAFDELLNP